MSKQIKKGTVLSVDGMEISGKISPAVAKMLAKKGLSHLLEDVEKPEKPTVKAKK